MNEQAIQGAIDVELEALLGEFQTLVTAKSRHIDNLHNTPAALGDRSGGMKFCPGCREIVLGRRIKDIIEIRDDNGFLPSGNRSRRGDGLENFPP